MQSPKSSRTINHHMGNIQYVGTWSIVPERRGCAANRTLKVESGEDA